MFSSLLTYLVTILSLFVSFRHSLITSCVTLVINPVAPNHAMNEKIFLCHLCDSEYNTMGILRSHITGVQGWADEMITGSSQFSALPQLSSHYHTSQNDSDDDITDINADRTIWKTISTVCLCIADQREERTLMCLKHHDSLMHWSQCYMPRCLRNSNHPFPVSVASAVLSTNNVAHRSSYSLIWKIINTAQQSSRTYSQWQPILILGHQVALACTCRSHFLSSTKVSSAR